MNAIDRLVLRLVCGHNLIADTVEGEQFPTSDYCPACGLYVSVTGYDEYRDEDVSA